MYENKRGSCVDFPKHASTSTFQFQVGFSHIAQLQFNTFCRYSQADQPFCGLSIRHYLFTPSYSHVYMPITENIAEGINWVLIVLVLLVERIMRMI